GERAEVVAHPAGPRGPVGGETLVRLAVGLALLLPQESEPRQYLIARFAAVDLHVVVYRVGGEQAQHGAYAEPALRDERLEHAARVGVQVAGCLADHRIGQNVGESAGELPGVEERHPVDVAEQLAQRIVLETLYTRHARRRRRVRRPVDGAAVGARRSQRGFRNLEPLGGMLLAAALVLLA